MKYNIYYQINGKKFQQIVEARNMNSAREKIKNQIKFDKIDIIKNEDEVVNMLKNIFGMFD